MSRTAFQKISCVAGLFFANFAAAGTVQFQLGEQDFADGKTPIFSREIRAAGTGEPFPFDGTIFGDDMKASGLGAFDYTHTFDLGGSRPMSATLTVGLIDIDSPPEQPLDTLSLLFNGVAQPTDLLRGISASGSASSVEVVEIPVPIDLLADGSLHVAIAARRAGYGNMGNAIEPDFSRLVIEIASRAGDLPTGVIDPRPPIVNPPGDPNLIPLPPALVPAGILLTSLAAMPRKRLWSWLRI